MFTNEVFGKFGRWRGASGLSSRGLRALSWLLAVALASIMLAPWDAMGQGESIPGLTVTPAVVQQGGTVAVATTNHAPGTFCVGLDGPGQNFALGASPRLHIRLGELTVGGGPDPASGSATVTIPQNVPSGVYSVILGGCAPQPDLGPLAWTSTATLIVGPAIPLTSEPRPSQTWFFAEGSTQPPFDTWLHLFNPSPDAPGTATIAFFGEELLRPVSVGLPPRQRVSVFLNELLPPTAFGMRVEASLPIVAERAMFFRQDGTASVGAQSPSTTWLLAEGSTQFPFHTWILMLNPGPVAADVALQFVTQDGRRVPASVTIAPNSRFSLFVNEALPDAAFSTWIGSSQPIVVERSMFHTVTGGGHNAPGVIAPQNAWFFAEGSTQPPFDTWYLVHNPNNHPIRVTAQFLLQDAGPGPTLDLEVPAQSRTSLFANQIVPNVAGGATFTSQGGPIVVERAMYFRSGAHATVGATSLSRLWLFAEGSSQPPFDNWLLLANPSSAQAATATVTFGLPNGQTASQTLSLPPLGRRSVFANLSVPNQPLTTRVESDAPIVVERSMFLTQGIGGTNTIGVSE